MRDRRRSSGDDAQRWVTTYSDVVTLLLAFFVLLFAMSEVDPERFEQLVQGLEEPFGNPGNSAVLPASDGILENRGPAPTSPPPPNAAESEQDPKDDEPGGEQGPEEPPLLVDQSELIPVEEELRRALAEAGFEHAADLEINERGLVVSIATDGLLFSSGSAELREEGVELLAAIAPALLEIANPVQIEGHTDDVPYAGGGYDNWNLSSDRALSVLRLLGEEHDMEPARLGATGFASFRPVEPNDSPAGRAANRRVELVVAVKGES